MRLSTRLAAAFALTFVAAFSVRAARAQSPTNINWRAAEAESLTNHVQLTFPEQFVKAGEAYFNPDARWVIFQAVPVPTNGSPADTIYSMYVAKVRYSRTGLIVGLEKPILVSPPGSANTCGWFHPTDPGRIIFGSTLVKPIEGPEAGYQRGANSYRWAFPAQTDVVTTVVPQMVRDYERNARGAHSFAALFDQKPPAPTPLWTRPGYDAECSFSADGRLILHTRVNPKTNDPDLYLYDTLTGASKPIVVKPGYDGGPFFSPDSRRICYRSDRRGNDLLQLFVTDLVPTTDSAGQPTVELIEHQLTDDENVNWAPFWHPSGKFLIYASSKISHHNYEVFSIEAPTFGADEDTTPLRTRRLTYADGFDGLPVFSNDGRWMMWTSQRGAMIDGETKPSSQIWAAQVVNAAP